MPVVFLRSPLKPCLWISKMGGWYVTCHRQFWNRRWEYRPCACQVTGMTCPLSIFVQRSLLKWKRCRMKKKKTRASREKNELPSRSLLAKRSPSSRDRMDLKVACLVDTTPYTASINGRQPNPNCNPTFYHNQYMPYPNLKTRTSERMFCLIRTGLWLLWDLFCTEMQPRLQLRQNMCYSTLVYTYIHLKSHSRSCIHRTDTVYRQNATVWVHRWHCCPLSSTPCSPKLNSIYLLHSLQCWIHFLFAYLKRALRSWKFTVAGWATILANTWVRVLALSEQYL